MRVLLDTNAFLWAAEDSPRLSRAARRVMDDVQNVLYLSAVSGLEIAIKYGRGRLDLSDEPAVYVPSRMSAFGLEPLAVDFRHVLSVAKLPPVHRDPFDRLLVAQALVEGLPIVTGDANIPRYGVEVVW